MLLVGLLGLTVSCVTPPNVPVFTELSPNKAWGTYTLSEEEFYVDNKDQKFKDVDGNLKTWSELKAVSLYVPASSWAKIKSFILKICKKSNDCAKDIAKWQRKTVKIDDKLTKERK